MQSDERIDRAGVLTDGTTCTSVMLRRRTTGTIMSEPGSVLVEDRPTEVIDAVPTTNDLAPETFERYMRMVLALTVAGMAGTLWLPMMSDGLRLDENLTAWIVDGSAGEAIGRSWRHQGQSPLYFILLWGWQQILGNSEWALRLPSLIATLVAAWHVRRIGDDLDKPGTGIAAAGVFLGLYLVNIESTTARPYALLVLGTVAAARFGIAWTRTGRRRFGVGLVFMAAFTIYMHPFAAYALVPHLIWPYRRFRSGASVRELALLGALALALIAPIVPQVLSLAQRQDALVIVRLKPLTEIVPAIVPAAVVLGWLGGFVVARCIRRVEPKDDHVWAFVLAWAALPPIALILQSHVTGNAVFLSRYYSGSAPAIALLAGMVFCRLGTRHATVVALLFVLAIRVVDPIAFGTNDWSGAAEIINAQPEDTAVLSMTGFIEAADSSILDDPETAEYLNAPLRYHGVTRSLRTMPLNVEGANGNYAAQLLSSVAEKFDRVIIVQAEYEGIDYRRYASGRLGLDGFVAVENVDLAGVYLTVLRRP